MSLSLSATWVALAQREGGGSINGQVVVSALGSGRACSPRLSSPTIHSGRFQCIQVHQCILALSLAEWLGCDPLDPIGSGMRTGQWSLLCWVHYCWPHSALPGPALLGLLVENCSGFRLRFGGQWHSTFRGWGCVCSACWDSPQPLLCSRSGSSIAISCRPQCHTL